MAQHATDTIPRPLTIFPDHRHPTIPYHLWPSFQAFAFEFRVPSHEELARLFRLLDLPVVLRATFRGRTTYTCSGMDALAVTLARLSYPGRLRDIIGRLRLDWSISKLSLLFSACARRIQARWGNLAKFDPRVFEDPVRLRTFAATIHNHGYPLMDCVGFIDGTAIGIARPAGNANQRAFYNGLHRGHEVVWQAVTTPDGQLASFFGPHPGEW
jgi:hypothetical protein